MQLTKEEYNFLLEWIQCNFIPRKTTVAKAFIECGYSPLCIKMVKFILTYLINLELFKYTMPLLAIPQRLVHFNGCSVSEF